MEKRQNILILIAILLICLSGCDRQKEPSVSLLNDRFINTNATISPGGALSFKWMAEKGKADLSSFTIKVNGDDLFGYPVTSIPPDIYFDSTYLEGPSEGGQYTFAFVATDSDGSIGEKAVVVSVE